MTGLTETGRVDSETIRAWERHLGREVDADSLRAELVEGTLTRAFYDTAMRDPEQTALTIDGQEITHGELDHLAARAGGWLQAQGVGSGERIVLCGDNSLDFVIAYLGILRAGSIVVPAGAALTESELRHFVEDSGASCALAQGDALERLMRIAHEDSLLRLVVALEEEEASEAPSLRQAISEGAPLEPGDAGGDDVVMLAYTSGTTGRPKGVPLSHAHLLSSVRGVMWAWRWGASDVVAHALPFSHQHGLSAVHISLLCGSRTVVHSRFDPERLCKAIEAEKATVLFAVPAIYEKLVTWEGIGKADFSSLRLAVSGSSGLSPALARKVSPIVGQNVLGRYGG